KMCAHGDPFVRLQRCIETAHSAVHKAMHLVGAPQQLAPALPFRDHLFWLERVLREARARAALAFLGITPTRFHHEGVGAQSEIEAELLRAALAEDHIQDSAIDRAVRREEQHRAYERAWLAEPIDATFALLMPSRIPGQIV